MERGEEAQRELSHSPASAEAGPALLDPGQCQHKELCHIPKFYWRDIIFILCAVGIR